MQGGIRHNNETGVKSVFLTLGPSSAILRNVSHKEKNPGRESSLL